MILLWCVLYFNPRAFIKTNVVTRKNRSLMDAILFRQPKVSVLQRSPMWKLIKKQAAYLGEETDVETRGRKFDVDGECYITEQASGGYLLSFSDGTQSLWTPNISAGYICSGSFYTSPHPVTYKEGDLVGTILVIVVGLLVAIAITVPNFMDFLIYKEVATEKTKKFKIAAYVSLIFASVILTFIAFIASDIALDTLGAPHLLKDSKDKCYVISNYQDIFEARGNNSYSKQVRKEIKAQQRKRLRRAMMKMLADGAIPNNSRTHLLAHAGLLADVDEPFEQQASMRLVDPDSRLYHFTVPCGSSIVNLSPNNDGEQVSYSWQSDIYFSSEVVKATFIESAIPHEYKWCRNLLNNAKSVDDWKKMVETSSDVDKTVKEELAKGFKAIITGNGKYDWAVWAWTCGASRMHGKCMYGFRWTDAGDFYMRRVYRNGQRYLKRCSVPEGSEFIDCSAVVEKNLEEGGEVDSTAIYNVVHNDTYGERMDGWIENMSHMIMQQGWSGWNPNTFIASGTSGSSFKSWRSSIIPSDRDDDIIDVITGMIGEHGKGKNFKCTIDYNEQANMRLADEVCQTEFDMVVSDKDKWVETAKPCTHVYTHQTGDKIQVHVDEQQASIGNDWCSVILTIGDLERAYYIKPGQPWVGLHLDKWRCETEKNGPRGINCGPHVEPQDVNPDVFSGQMPTITIASANEPVGSGIGSLVDGIKERVLHGLKIFGIIVGCIAVVVAAVLIFTWIKRKECIETASDVIDLYGKAQATKGGGGNMEGAMNI